MMFDLTRCKVLTFDCYGTLIDWEAGILEALRPLLSRHGMALSDAEILTHYAAIEPTVQQAAYVPYKTILQRVVDGLGAHLGFTPTADERDCLIRSLGTWQPFADTNPALETLKKHFQLVVISNIDDDLFAQTARHFSINFDWVITAEQVGSYKPAQRNFKVALDHMGIPQHQVLHVAQSLYHDIVPAKALGLATVWVNRRKGLEGFGATPEAQAQPDLEVPDLKTLVSYLPAAV